MGLTRSSMPLDNCIQVEASLFEGIHDLVAHFKTILTDAGAHDGQDMLGTGTLTAHLLNNCLGDSTHRPAPPCMGNSDDARLNVCKHNRDAIGGIHANDNTLQLGHQCVNAFKGSLLLVDVQRAETLINDSHMA